MMDIEAHYQLCIDQEDGKPCICESIIESAQEADIDSDIDNYLHEISNERR